MSRTPPDQCAVTMDRTAVLDRLCHRYPSLLVDEVSEHEHGRRLVAHKNVSVDEEFFQGHFPGSPVMPGVLMVESLVQAATLLIVDDGRPEPPRVHVELREVRDAKFRRQVVPGDRVRLEVVRAGERGPLVRVRAGAYIGPQVVAEMELVLAVLPERVSIHPSAHVAPTAVIGEGTLIGPGASIGPEVQIGRECRIGASTVIDGHTEIGDHNHISPFVSIGLAPQDLKYRGEATRVSIGHGNTIREFVTIHRGTMGGGGVTRIGDRNVFMAYAHVAHDCQVGSDIVFAHGATLGGHVHVEDFATISGLSAVHQFCRIGRHAFIGGASAVTKDAMPFAKTVGNRARLYGLNTVGLVRRGFPPEVVAKLKRAYRYLLVSKLNTSRAVAAMERDESVRCPEVDYLVEFIRTSHRGVSLRRPTRKGEEAAVDE